MNNVFQHIPWVEKYRPNKIENIILEDNNKQFIFNMLEKQIYPNLLLYGPPGTGKTTTIINIINSIYPNDINKSIVLHLNASDERGIEMIRTQIHKFISSKPLFVEKIKFVILDEVDYMTKSAQNALKYLLQQYNTTNLVFYPLLQLKWNPLYVWLVTCQIDFDISSEVHVKFEKMKMF